MGDNDKDPKLVFVCLRKALNLDQQFSEDINDRAVQVKKDEVVLTKESLFHTQIHHVRFCQGNIVVLKIIL